MENWLQKYGEEQVNAGVARLRAHVAESWQPTWRQFAGILLPSELDEDGYLFAPEPHAEEQFDTAPPSNPYTALFSLCVAIDKILADENIGPPSPLRLFSDAEVQTSHPTESSSASLVEGVDGIQSPAKRAETSVERKEKKQDKMEGNAAA